MYEELETSNDTATKSLTATVDPAADGTVTPASAESRPAQGSGVFQAAYRTSTSATPAAAGDTAVIGAVDSGAGDGGSFGATPLASDGKWEVAGSSGAFTWSYPLTTSPAPPRCRPALGARGRPGSPVAGCGPDAAAVLVPLCRRRRQGRRIPGRDVGFAMDLLVPGIEATGPSAESRRQLLK